MATVPPPHAPTQFPHVAFWGTAIELPLAVLKATLDDDVLCCRKRACNGGVGVGGWRNGTCPRSRHPLVSELKEYPQVSETKSIEREGGAVHYADWQVGHYATQEVDDR